MRSCDEPHEQINPLAWPGTRKHYHPGDLQEAIDWLVKGEDRVRDREFDVVVGFVDVEWEADQQKAEVYWLNQREWHYGADVDPRFHYDVSDDGYVEEFFLLPHETTDPQAIEAAIASIRSTYEEG